MLIPMDTLQGMVKNEKEGFKGNMRKGIPTGEADVRWDVLRYKGNLKNGVPNGEGGFYTVDSSTSWYDWKKSV